MKKLVLVMAMTAMLAPMVAQASCATQAEAKAINLRALKSSLMVAALSCGQQSEYNAFIRKNQAMFSSDGQVVKGYFSRNYGSGGEYQLNRFVTKMANDASNSSMGQDSESYCAAMKETFGKLVSMDRSHVMDHAAGAQYASLHGIRTCAVEGEALAMNSTDKRSTK